MELSSINACVVATTVVDDAGEMHTAQQRHTRVTRASIKRLLQAEIDAAPLGHRVVAACAVTTRIDHYFAIEVNRLDGPVEELGVVELQQSLIARLRALGGGGLRGVTPRALDDFTRPLTRAAHAEIVGRLIAPDDLSPVAHLRFAAGLAALDRSLDLAVTAERLGVHWTKSKMLEIRADANPAYGAGLEDSRQHR